MTRAIAPVMLALAGEHRFAKYAVVFRIDLLPGQRSWSGSRRAPSSPAARAALQGGVIGTRGHVLVVNRMLRAIKRAPSAAPTAHRVPGPRRYGQPGSG